MTYLRYMILPLMLGAAPALADSYEVTLAAPQSNRVIIKDTQWTCAGDKCAGLRTGNSPDANVCVAAARKLGRVTAFAAGAKPFDADKLARCNQLAGVDQASGSAIATAH